MGYAKPLPAVGEKVGELFFVREVERRHPKKRLFEWRCKCGNLCYYRMDLVKVKRRISCGCEYQAIKHDDTIKVDGKIIRSSEWVSWQSMRNRVKDKTEKKYKHYGGKGVTVCKRWSDKKTGYAAFLEDMGKKDNPEQTIDRKDNDANYSCGHCEECIEKGWAANCRWATPLEQSMNSSSPKFVTFNNKTMHLSAWAKEMGVKRGQFSSLMHFGWTFEQIADKYNYQYKNE